jgi:hypothetical protein
MTELSWADGVVEPLDRLFGEEHDQDHRVRDYRAVASGDN